MNWEIAYTYDMDGRLTESRDYKTPDELRRSGLTLISAKVPGNFESELVKIGAENDYTVSVNIKNLEKYKATHVWYFSEFNTYDFSCFHFDRLYANAIVYVNGVERLRVNRTLQEFEISEGLNEGLNSIVVHIFPSEDERITAASRLGINTKGIDGEAGVRRKRKCEIRNAYVRTVDFDKENDIAKVRFTAEIDIREDCKYELSHLKYRAALKDEKRLYSFEGDVYGNKIDCVVEVSHPKLWFPKNYGRAYLYDASVTVLDNGRQLDVFDIKTGIRRVSADRTGAKANDIGFTVNGIGVFLSGANTCPTELLKQESDERIEETVNAAQDLNCNVLRYVGGYAPEVFLDACDKAGICVIQDVPGALQSYTDTAENLSAFSSEVNFFLARIRNHPSAIAFSMDYCDNPACAQVISKALSSTPDGPVFMETGCCDTANTAIENSGIDGAFFTGTIGCPSFPSSESLGKFINKKYCRTLHDEEGNLDENFASHIFFRDSALNDGRDTLTDTVKDAYGTAFFDFDSFTKQIQILQAEQIKKHIESYRARVGKTSGVIAFDLNDSHTLISESVIDYYQDRKLACSFIKKTLAPLCLMITSDDNGEFRLFAVNDLPYGDQVTYTVKDLSENSALITSGISDIFAFTGTSLTPVFPLPGHFYQITWTTRAGRTYTNHFYCKADQTDFEKYVNSLTAAGYQIQSQKKIKSKSEEEAKQVG